jgi:hypothetical protein
MPAILCGMNNDLLNKAKTAIATGDTKAFAECLFTAMENDIKSAEVEHQRREAAVEAFQATPAPTSRYKIISIQGRIGRRPATLYITGVSFKDGDGYKVSKIRYGAEKAKAQEFSTMAATGISEYLIRCGYSPKLEAK